VNITVSPAVLATKNGLSEGELKILPLAKGGNVVCESCRRAVANWVACYGREDGKVMKIPFCKKDEFCESYAVNAAPRKPFPPAKPATPVEPKVGLQAYSTAASRRAEFFSAPPVDATKKEPRIWTKLVHGRTALNPI